MSTKEIASDLSPLNGLWKAFASLKLTIVLFNPGGNLDHRNPDPSE